LIWPRRKYTFWNLLNFWRSDYTVWVVWLAFAVLALPYMLVVFRQPTFKSIYSIKMGSTSNLVHIDKNHKKVLVKANFYQCENVFSGIVLTWSKIKCIICNFLLSTLYNIFKIHHLHCNVSETYLGPAKKWPILICSWATIPPGMTPKSWCTGSIDATGSASEVSSGSTLLWALLQTET
jgi:hypothetical protein